MEHIQEENTFPQWNWAAKSPKRVFVKIVTALHNTSRLSRHWHVDHVHTVNLTITKWLTSSDRNHKIFPYIPVRKVVYNGRSIETLNRITMERAGTLSKTTKPIAFSNRPPNDSQNTIFYHRSRPPKKTKRLQNNIHTFCYQIGNPRNIILFFTWELLPFATTVSFESRLPSAPNSSISGKRLSLTF